MMYPPPTDPAPAAVRHRRSDRHRTAAQDAQPFAPSQPISPYAAPTVQPYQPPAYQAPSYQAPAYGAVERPQPMAQQTSRAAHPARKKKKKRAASQGLSAAQWTVLGLMLTGVLIAVFLWMGAAADLRTERERRELEAQAYQERIDLYLTKQARYRALIETYAAQYGLDPAYVSAIIMEESSYDPRAVSNVGARGLMQFMPATFDWVKKNCGYGSADFDVVFQPEPAIKMGCYLLNYIIRQLGTDDPILVACAYHAGWGNISTWIANYSTDGKTLTVDQIPKGNTRDYAGKVIDSYAIYLQNYYEVDGGADDPDAAVPVGAGDYHGSVPDAGHDLGEDPVHQSVGG